MKKILLFTFALILLSNTQAQLVSYEKIDSLTIQEMNQVIDDFGATGIIVPQYDVDVYRVIYETEYAGGMKQVSGALAVPKNLACPGALVSYQHGTTSTRTNVPSFGSSELNIVTIFASEGNIVAAPDYIGLGVSTDVIHPYVHAYSQAHSTINLLRSTREMNETLDLNMSNQLFLFGYSQGGHATAAAVKYIETEYSDEFKVTASAPMSGPYNLAGAQTDFVNSGQPYATPGYLPFLIFGYQGIYGDLYDSIQQYFREPYATDLFPLFEGGVTGIGTINGLCTPNPADMFTQEAETAFNNDPNFPLRVRLEENDLLDWTPNSPMNLYYCSGDEQVYYRNGEIADSVWSANGANVEGILLGSGDHGDCVPLALIAGRGFFNSYLNFGIEITATYNANTNQIVTNVTDANLSDFTISWANGTSGNVLDNVADGQDYVVTFTNTATGCSASRTLSTQTILGILDKNAPAELSFYPNPSADLIHIKSNLKGIYSMQIIDASGKVVFAQPEIRSSDLSINVNYLSSGVYTLVLSGDAVKTAKFVKQ